MRRLLTGLFIIVFLSMCAVTACVHPVGSITDDDIENSGSGGNENPGGNGGENSGSGSDGGIGIEWQ